MKLTEEIKEFIEAHQADNIQTLALQLSKKPDLPRQLILQQIHGLQIAKKKLPTWDNSNLLFPTKVSLEQCSSEITAQYKSAIHSYSTFADLSGGFGVDTKHFADHSSKGVYVESYKELFEITKHNLSYFHPNKIDYFNEDAESFLAHNKNKFDLIYLDPDRRSEKHSKGVSLEDCTPNVIELKSQLLSVGKIVLIKCSPLIDIKSTVHLLGNVSRIDILSVQNDCKEVLFTINEPNTTSIIIHTVNFTKDGVEKFDFSYSIEEKTSSSFSLPLQYIYEPNSSILKAGAFKTIGAEYKLAKLAPSSHVYTSNELISDFPGRIFQVLETTSKHNRLPKKANIISRNHPKTPEQIKEKSKIKDGGNQYIIATTDIENHPIYIIANRIK